MSKTGNEKNKTFIICISAAAVIFLVLIVLGIMYLAGGSRNEKQLDELRNIMENTEEPGNSPEAVINPENENPGTEVSGEEIVTEPVIMMLQTGELYSMNNDFIGWIKIPDTNIDYPVMQTHDDKDTPEDEGQYYLYRDFTGELQTGAHRPGSLFFHDDTEVGVGYIRNNYAGGISPSENMLLFGHCMANGQMFGNLYRFLDEEYCMEHRRIQFASLYEDREYRIVSVFKSHVFYTNEMMDYSLANDPNFKYYMFTGEIKGDLYGYFVDNIISHNEISGLDYIPSEGDTFLTLSTCWSIDEYNKYNQYGRICVVAVRTK